MTTKEKIEITIDEEEACENFGEDTFQENIFRFVEEGYKNTYEEVKEAEFQRDSAKMKITTHTLKTTARYMCSENFAQICQGIESETKAPNWDKILELLPDFYEYYEILYQKTLKIYNRLKGKDPDDPGPLENKKENMVFYEREMQEAKAKEKKDSGRKISFDAESKNKQTKSEPKTPITYSNNKIKTAITFSAFNSPLGTVSAPYLSKSLSEEATPNFVNVASHATSAGLEVQSLDLNKSPRALGSEKITVLPSFNAQNFANLPIADKNAGLEYSSLNADKGLKCPLDESAEGNAPKSADLSAAAGEAQKVHEAQMTESNNALFSLQKKISGVTGDKDSQLTKEPDVNIDKDSKKIGKDSFANTNFFNKNVLSNEFKHLEENLKAQNLLTSNTVLNSQGKSHFVNVSAAEAANMNSMKNSIRSLREFDKQAGNIYFKNTKNDGDENITNAEFKKLFDVNCSNIKFTKFDYDAIKNFAEDGILTITSKLRKIIEVETIDKREFLHFFKELKTQLKNVHFSNVEQIIDNWVATIESMKSLKNYRLSWNDFGGFFKTLNDEVNDYLDNVEKNQTEELYKKDHWSYEDSGIARENKLRFPNDKDFLKSPIFSTNRVSGNKSEISSFPAKQEEDILSELKPVKFEGLYKKELSAEEITNEIQKLLRECLNVPQTSEKPVSTKFSRQNAVRDSSIQDHTYPFKEDKFSCSIF